MGSKNLPIRAEDMDRLLLSRVLEEEYAMNLTTQYHLVSLMRQGLAEEGYITGRTLRCRRNNEVVKVAGKVILIHTPPTKSGIRVMFVTLEDETGLIDLAVFPKAQKRYAKTITSSNILLVSGRLRRLGARDVSVVAHHVYPLKPGYGPWFGKSHRR